MKAAVVLFRTERLRLVSPGISPWLLSLLLTTIGGLVFQAKAALQFDVFLGYDGTVPEASWFPVVCEVKNDGPSFKATVEVSPGSYNQGQKHLTEVELPTGTLKRLVIPVFASTRGFSSWDVRLLDERGKTRAEQLGLQPRKQVAPGTPLVGALSRTPGGAPVIKEILSQNSDLQPTSARLLTSIFPDNPLVLEGLACLYLNSERASDLTVNQVNAIFSWVNSGGHLIVGVEQPSDVSSSPWLKGLVPCELKDLKSVEQHSDLQEWLRETTWRTNGPAGAKAAVPGGTRAQRNLRQRYGLANPNEPPMTAGTAANVFADLPPDLAFETAPMQVAAGELRQGTVLVGSGEIPLIVEAPRGRGRVTALLFSPEREPVRSWKNLPVLWAKLAGVPGELYATKNVNAQGGWSSDGIFGAMIDSRQVHKLPVGWLLLLLLIYLVVIGPLDQYWLKRIGKPMLTWITFPGYVVLFSLVIYLIGYKLRAGESEWNELHVVDILANGSGAELRGRTYSSVYSPSNQRYLLESQQKYATLRGEFAGLWGGGADTGEKATILQSGDSFKAEIFVPVWTSELFVSDWWNSSSLPLSAQVSPKVDGWHVQVENHTERKLTNIQMAIAGRMIALGDLPAGQSLTKPIKSEDGMPLRNFVLNYGATFREAVNNRQRALGASESGQISDLPNSSMAASFLSQLTQTQNYDYSFIGTPGLDLSPTLEAGGAVVLAWAGDYAPVKPMYQFIPRRSHRDTLWRLAVDVK
jgi:hypothetical protein